MKFLQIVFLIFLFGCKNESKTAEIQLPKYEILEKMEHLSMKINPAKGYYFGSVLIDPVGFSSESDFAKTAIEIAKKENLGQVSFYSDSMCFLMNSGKIKSDDKKMAGCYLGQIDVAKKGQDWKRTIVPNDFRPHVEFWEKKSK